MVRKFCFALLVICLCVLPVGAASVAMSDEYIFRDGLLFLGSTPVEIDKNTESAEVSVNGKNYKVIMPLDARRTGEAEVDIGVFAVVDGERTVAQLPVMEYQYFFDDDEKPFLSPTGKYLFSSSGTSPSQSIAVYTFPDLKEVASFDGCYLPIWDGDERIYFDKEVGYDSAKGVEILKPFVINIKSGTIKER